MNSMTTEIIAVCIFSFYAGFIVGKAFGRINTLQPPKTDYVVLFVTLGAVLFGIGLVLQIV